ncbi:phosphonate C-P lyase system protein PhnG [Salibacterium aidingense]|uniref:phosphonate C-P lyase system protein PhnG n=1 Tax=Salibacterium aidingense TaxID=384933 RepID=UPI003BEBF661
MKKSRLSRILVHASLDFIEDFSNQIEENYQISLETKPQKSLVLMKTKDSVSGLNFYNGEILVTECKVTIHHFHGFGIVMGEQPDRSFYMAVIDAAFNAELPEISFWKDRLIQEEARIEKEKLSETKHAEASRVQFDTMEGFDER